jgi:hypothetical protein
MMIFFIINAIMGGYFTFWADTCEMIIYFAWNADENSSSAILANWLR